MKLQSISKKRRLSLKKLSIISSISLLSFSAAHNVTAQLPSVNDNEILDILLPVLSSLSTQQNVPLECISPSALTISTAQVNGHQGSNIAENAFDDNTSTRWSSDAENEDVLPNGVGIITFDLGFESTITDLDLAWFRGEQRTTQYSVDISTDNITWTEVVAQRDSLQTSSANTFENNDIEDSQAQYLRITGNGNSQNIFTSLSEIVINGCDPSSNGGVTTSSSSSTSSSTSSTSSSSSSGSTTSSSSSGGVASSSSSGSVASSSSSGGIDPVFGLDPSLQPWDNFDLSVWGLDSPALRDTSASSGSSNFERGVRIDDIDFIALSEGESNSNFNDAEASFNGQSSTVESSAPYFFTADDGGMVFMSPIGGGRTSTNTSFPRSELREYSRAGVTRRDNGRGGTENVSTTGTNENNWVLGYQPAALELNDNSNIRNIQNVGGRNGVLKATLRVNRVTVTGAEDDIGSTIIGQIHAEDDEPLRLYYRKLRDFDLGTVYAVHEIRRSRGDETPVRFGRDTPDRNLVGDSRDFDEFEEDIKDDLEDELGSSAFNNLSDQEIAEEVTDRITIALADGIALDELFSYEIINEGQFITVNLIRGDADQPIIASTTYDMATIVNQRDEADGDPVGSGYDRADESMYFKAGAYTQNNTGDDDDFDQITFYRLSVSHDENDCGTCFNVSE